MILFFILLGLLPLKFVIVENKKFLRVIVIQPILFIYLLLRLASIVVELFVLFLFLCL